MKREEQLMETLQTAVSLRMAAIEFATEVRAMRALQKQYFETRDREVLIQAKAAERRVDEMLG